MWIIDFGEMPLEEASKYEKPFQYVLTKVKPVRDKSPEATLRERWWLFGRSRPAMRKAINPLHH
jgi:hypothetical protein